MSLAIMLFKCCQFEQRQKNKKDSKWTQIICITIVVVVLHCVCVLVCVHSSVHREGVLVLFSCNRPPVLMENKHTKEPIIISTCVWWWVHGMNMFGCQATPLSMYLFHVTANLDKEGLDFSICWAEGLKDRRHNCLAFHHRTHQVTQTPLYVKLMLTENNNNTKHLSSCTSAVMRHKQINNNNQKPKQNSLLRHEKGGAGQRHENCITLEKMCSWIQSRKTALFNQTFRKLALLNSKVFTHHTLAL